MRPDPGMSMLDIDDARGLREAQIRRHHTQLAEQLRAMGPHNSFMATGLDRLQDACTQFLLASLPLEEWDDYPTETPEQVQAALTEAGQGYRADQWPEAAWPLCDACAHLAQDMIALCPETMALVQGVILLREARDAFIWALLGT